MTVPPTLAVYTSLLAAYATDEIWCNGLFVCARQQDGSTMTAYSED